MYALGIKYHIWILECRKAADQALGVILWSGAGILFFKVVQLFEARAFHI